jgi:hypothetical protein
VDHRHRIAISAVGGLVTQPHRAESLATEVIPV